jgi:hypothetical protein
MTLNTTDIAAELGTDPRSLRKFLRADAKVNGTPTPGKGARYAIERKQLRSLKSRFAKYTAALEAKAAQANDDATDDATDEVEVDDAEVPATDAE